MVEREHWGTVAILARVARGGVTEARTNYLKERRKPATFISGKRTTEVQQQMQTPLGTYAACWQHQMKANSPASH